jgi:hypothetical protein
MTAGGNGPSRGGRRSGSLKLVLQEGLEPPQGAIVHVHGSMLQAMAGHVTRVVLGTIFGDAWLCLGYDVAMTSMPRLIAMVSLLA